MEDYDPFPQAKVTEVRFRVTYQLRIEALEDLKETAADHKVEWKHALTAIQLQWDAAGDTYGRVHLLQMNTGEYYWDCEQFVGVDPIRSWEWYVEPEAGDGQVFEVVE